MAAKWLRRFVIFRGSDPVLQRNPLLCDFSGGGGVRSPALPPYGSAHALTFLLKQLEANSYLAINVKYFYLLL